MSIHVLLSQNAYFSPPGGYPITLGGVGEYSAKGMITPDVQSVSAVVKAGATADVHLALYAAPTVVGGPDGALLVQTDAIGVTATPVTLTVLVPVAQPACYVARLWVTNISATIADPIARTSLATYSIAQNPGIPQTVSVLAMAVT